MKILFGQEIYKRVLVFDGAMGTQLIQNGLKEDECPDYLSLTKPDVIYNIHKAYFEAGADCVETNTFGANRIKLKKYGLEDKVFDINKNAIEIAKEVAKEYRGFVGQSIGPLGELLNPAGMLEFDEAVDIFYEQIAAGFEAGADFISIETMSDVKEAKAAFLAYKKAKSHFNKDIACVVSLTFEQNAHTLMGTPPTSAAYLFSLLGADLVGANCSGGARQLLGIIEKMSGFSFVPLSVKPNAGLPKMVNGKVLYEDCIVDFVNATNEFISNGVRLYGGCCGTNPEYISEIARLIKEKEMAFESNAKKHFISSIYSVLDITKGFNYLEFRLDNDFSIESIYELVGLEEDAILVDIVADTETAVLRSFLLESQDFVKKPYLFNIKSNLQLDVIDRYYFGIYGAVGDLCGVSGVKVSI